VGGGKGVGMCRASGSCLEVGGGVGRGRRRWEKGSWRGVL